MRAIVLGVVAFGAAWVGALAIPPGEPVAALERREDFICKGGPASPLRVQLEPSGGNAWALRLASSFTRTTLTRYAVELVDDAGQPMDAPTLSNPEWLDKDAPVTRILALPPQLGDGDYQLRVTAVATDGESGASEITSVYFKVLGGEAAPLSHAQWINSTRAGVANHTPASR